VVSPYLNRCRDLVIMWGAAGHRRLQDAKIGPDNDIPHVTAPIIVKYIRDLHLLGLL
jgi:hypothetical protein